MAEPMDLNDIMSYPSGSTITYRQALEKLSEQYPELGEDKKTKDGLLKAFVICVCTSMKYTHISYNHEGKKRSIRVELEDGLIHRKCLKPKSFEACLNMPVFMFWNEVAFNPGVVDFVAARNIVNQPFIHMGTFDLDEDKKDETN